MSSQMKIATTAIVAAFVSIPALASSRTHDDDLSSPIAPRFNASTTGPFVPINQFDDELVGHPPSMIP